MSDELGIVADPGGVKPAMGACAAVPDVPANPLGWAAPGTGVVGVDEAAPQFNCG